ncbi:MAG: hypothetical protein CL840_21430 [Crocinitomicaceae bacterium]|nr:hypothetical protein [Crocinitomicaceae bacterium]|tara:strand:- start:9137 stop:10171 length:1035 start_codon:yes stop_codon:yes gene_type:complete
MMEHKVKNASIILTGANGRIGLETVKQLIKLSPKRIVLACRTIEKATEAIKKIEKSAVKLEPFGGFDMNNRDSIANAVAGLPEKEKFDIVFLQSGGMVVADDFQFINANGKKIERTIYQNVFGGYNTVLELKKQGLLADNARIVFAGGEGARGIKGMIKKPEFKHPEEINQYIYSGNGSYNDLNAIGVSKFMSALLVQKLAVLDKQHTYVWFSPGLTAGTKGLINVPQPKRFVMEKVGFPMIQLFGLAQNPRLAAKKYADCLDGKYGKNGDLIGAPEGKALGKLVDQKPMNKGLTNRQFRDTFWKIIKDNCGDISFKLVKYQRLLLVRHSVNVNEPSHKVGCVS